MKILYVRDKGPDINLPGITSNYLKFLKSKLDYILGHNTLVLDLDGSGSLNWYNLTKNLDWSAYDLIIGHGSGVKLILKISQTQKLKNVLLLGGTHKHNYLNEELLSGWYVQTWDFDSIVFNISSITFCYDTNGKVPERDSLELAYYLGHKVKLLAFNDQNNFDKWLDINSTGSEILKNIINQILESR